MFFKDLFTHISDRIETVKDVNNDPLIRWIDFDLGQLEDNPPPVSFPCALIGFGEADQFVTQLDGSQRGQLAITVRFAIKLRERTHSKASSAYRDEALNHLDAIETVTLAIQGTSGANFGKILRGSINQEKRQDFRVYTIGFNVEVYTEVPPHIADKYVKVPKTSLAFCLHKDIVQ